MVLECRQCGRTFNGAKGQGFCCSTCFHESRRNLLAPGRWVCVVYMRHCVICGQIFPGRLKQHKACSEKCVRVLACRSASKRRAAKMGSQTEADAALVEFYAWVRTSKRLRCYWCSKVTRRADRHVDHIIPLIRGGAHMIANLCCSCSACNYSKGSQMPDTFSAQAHLGFWPSAEDREKYAQSKRQPRQLSMESASDRSRMRAAGKFIPYVSLKQHGLSKLPEYFIWVSIRSRCINPNDSVFAYYGGRGIQLCQRWQDSPQAFIDDMGSRPTPEHQIKRKFHDGDYEPGNCVWAVRAELGDNRRSNVWLEYLGRTQTAKQWADELGIPESRILLRHKRYRMPMYLILYKGRLNRTTRAKVEPVIKAEYERLASELGL